MSTGQKGQPGDPGKPGAGTEPPDATTEDAAAFLVAKMVRNAADATAEWLQDSAAAFETSLTQAVKGGYSTDQFATDLAKTWKRNLTLAAKLVVASQPAADPADETVTKTSTGAKPSAAEGSTGGG